MIQIEKVEESILEKFFLNADLENEVIESVFQCMRRKDYVKVVEKYGLEQLKTICLVDYSTGVNDRAIFAAMKSIPQSTDFI